MAFSNVVSSAMVLLLLISVGCLSVVHAKISAVFFFGDSLVDTGNAVLFPNITRYRVSLLPPYGITYFKKPTGRFSDGRLVTDFILEKLNLSAPPILQPGANFSTGANFAAAGATVLGFNSDEPQNFAVQLKFYQSFILNPSTSPGPEAIRNGLYVIQIGSKDVSQYVISSQIQAAFTINQYAITIANSIESAIKALYGTGANKFLLFSVSHIGCSPYLRLVANLTGPGCVPVVTSIVNAINKELVSRVRSLRKSLPGIDLLYVKQDSLLKIVANPTKFGFESSGSACCGGGVLNAQIICALPNTTVCSNPSKSVFWDYLHGTEHSYRMVFKRVWSGSISSISPINLSRLSRRP